MYIFIYITSRNLSIMSVHKCKHSKMQKQFYCPVVYDMYPLGATYIYIYRQAERSDHHFSPFPYT